MHFMRAPFLPAALIASALLAGCSGGGGGSSPNPIATSPSTSSPSQTQSIQAISDANAFGSPLKDFADFDKTADTSGSSGNQSSARVRLTATGACNNGVEFYSPDRNGDENSTETIDYYDSGCTEEALDVVRLFTSTGASSESVALTESLFAPGNATAIATRSETHTITNATFNAYGYPLASDGYDLVASDALTIGSAKTIDSNSELVMAPASSGTNAFCSDSAGFNATGFSKLGITFGWQGGVLGGGTRTVNADGSVTWTATHAGMTYKGPIGGLSVATGVQNAACPISTPMFTLAGGTAVGSYSIPITVTYAHGMLESLTITNATLGDGDTLSVTTTTGVPGTSPQFVTGSVSNGTTQIATFAVDAYGDGTLTITATGAQYVMTDWHVTR
jgi:hypothetical protein